MGSVTVRVGPKNRRRKVECVPIAEGLVAHTPPELEKSSGLLNITHTKSGLAVVQHIPEECLPGAISILGKVGWALDMHSVYRSDLHFKAVKEVCYMANRKDSQKQESRLADDLGGRVQPGSGARWGYRRDVVTKDYLIEAKCTDSGKYLVSEKDFDHLTKQAYEIGKVPVYAVSINGDADVIVMPHNELDEEFFEYVVNHGHKVRDLSKRNRKSISIDAKMSDYVGLGNVIVYHTKNNTYALIGYDAFLYDVKRGVNE